MTDTLAMWLLAQTGLMAVLAVVLVFLAWRLPTLARALNEHRDAQDHSRHQALLAHLTQMAEKLTAEQGAQSARQSAQHQALLSALMDRLEAGIQGHVAVVSAISQLAQGMADEAKTDRSLQTKFFQHLNAGLSKGPDRVVAGIQQHLAETTQLHEKLETKLESTLRKLMLEINAETAIQMLSLNTNLTESSAQVVSAVDNLHSEINRGPAQVVSSLQQHLITTTRSQERIGAQLETVLQESSVKSTDKVLTRMNELKICLTESSSNMISAIESLSINAVDLKITQAASNISTALNGLSTSFREASVRNNEIDSFLGLHVGEAADEYLRKIAEASEKPVKTEQTPEKNRANPPSKKRGG